MTPSHVISLQFLYITNVIYVHGLLRIDCCDRREDYFVGDDGTVAFSGLSHTQSQEKFGSFCSDNVYVYSTHILQ
jgi:hypothetical protein